MTLDLGHGPQPQSQSIPLSRIRPRYQTPEDNPNKMEPERFDGLVALMREKGCLQPILVRLDGFDGSDPLYEITDGHHRFAAAQLLDWPGIQCFIIRDGEEVSAALSLAMNRLRGDLDLSRAADIVRGIKIETGWTDEQAALLTGFTPPEIAELVRDAQPIAEDLLEQAAGAIASGSEPDASSDKPFVLEIRFTDKASYQLARRKLRKAGGPEKDLAAGLLAVLGETE